MSTEARSAKGSLRASWLLSHCPARDPRIPHCLVASRPAQMVAITSTPQVLEIDQGRTEPTESGPSKGSQAQALKHTSDSATYRSKDFDVGPLFSLA